ncbi:MAG TPA: hypothetical protein VMV05_03080 [bacterium]|nr:hypothetical protein [bacterium]
MLDSKRALLGAFILCALAFSLQIIPRWWGDSTVIDEEWDLTAAYNYWRNGDVWTDLGTSAPAALCALPLLPMDLFPPSPERKGYPEKSYWFLFMDNGAKLPSITLWSRSVNWLVGLAVGFLLYRLLKGGGLAEGIAGLLLWAFEPTLLAYGGTAQADMQVAFWFFLAVLAFARVQDSPRPLPFLAAGFIGGLAAAGRYNGLFILPVVAALEVLGWRRLVAHRGDLAARALKSLIWLAGFALAIALCYIPGTLAGPGHSSPFSLYAHYLSGYLDQQPGITGTGTFFAGKFWERGSYLNFPYHFFYKTTLPFFALLLAGVGGALTRKINLPNWVWVPPLVYLGLFMLSVKSMTLRHALPAFPFLVLLASRGWSWLWVSSRRWLGAAGGACLPLPLLAWHALSALLSFPGHLAYANELMPAWDKPTHLYSFDWDFGQDMKRLAELGKNRGWEKVKLMTSQRTDPHFYGLDWDPWTAKDLEAPQAGTVYILDPALLYDDMMYSDLFRFQSRWVGRLKPTGMVGDTLYYYEIPGDARLNPKDDSKPLNSFHYFVNGIPPYKPGGAAAASSAPDSISNLSDFR